MSHFFASFSSLGEIEGGGKERREGGRGEEEEEGGGEGEEGELYQLYFAESKLIDS